MMTIVMETAMVAMGVTGWTPARVDMYLSVLLLVLLRLAWLWLWLWLWLWVWV